MLIILFTLSLLSISCIPEAAGGVVATGDDRIEQYVNGEHADGFDGTIHTSKTIVNGTKPFTILVEGNIACGKSTFLRQFVDYDNLTLLWEPIDEWRNVSGWNIYDLKAQEPAKWVMPFQSFVSLTRLNQHIKPVTTPFKMIERSLYSGRYVFVEYAIRNGSLHPAEYFVLDEWYKFITRQIPIDVDLIVYLRTTPSKVYDRMSKRGRPEDRGITLAYLEDIHQLHEDWLIYKTLGECPAPVLTLNGDLSVSQVTEEYMKIHQILRQLSDVGSLENGQV